MPLLPSPVIAFSHGFVHLLKDSLTEAGWTMWIAPLPGAIPCVWGSFSWRAPSTNCSTARHDHADLTEDRRSASSPASGLLMGNIVAGHRQAAGALESLAELLFDSTEKDVDHGAVKVSPTELAVGVGVNRSPTLSQAGIGAVIGAGAAVVGRPWTVPSPLPFCGQRCPPSASPLPATGRCPKTSGGRSTATPGSVPLATGILTPVGFVLPMSVSAILIVRGRRGAERPTAAQTGPGPRSAALPASPPGNAPSPH